MEGFKALQACGRKLLTASVARLHSLYALKIYKIFCRAVKAVVNGVVKEDYLLETLFGKSHIAAYKCLKKSLEEGAAARSGRCHNSPCAELECFEQERHICLNDAGIALILYLGLYAVICAGGVLYAVDTAFFNESAVAFARDIAGLQAGEFVHEHGERSILFKLSYVAYKTLGVFAEAFCRENESVNAGLLIFLTSSTC